MRKHHGSVICAVLAAFIICTLWNPKAIYAQESEQHCRALLIACDEFVYATETTPIGRNNLQLMQSVLEQDIRGFEIHQQYGITSSKEALSYAIQWAFGDAREGDISLLYFCTHGEFDTSFNNPEGVLILSDGALEDYVTAQQLNAMLDEIKGTKVLVVDACNSGALMGKGVSPDTSSARVAKAFQSGDYKLLTSSGASESSWYWQANVDTAPPGSSYFTTALTLGAGYLGGFAADANRDGTITLYEMYNHLWLNQASSTVQMFPQEDDFPLFVYDRALLGEQQQGELNGFVFQNTWLDAARPVLTFHYTVRKSTRVAYRITPLKDGQWDWRNGVTLPDIQEFDGDADPMGDISPGRKQVTLDLTEHLPKGWTYAMIHVMTLGDRQSGRQPFIYASRILAAKPLEGDPSLSLKASATWQRAYKRELEIFISHAFACNMTLVVEDEAGQVVGRLLVSRPTRPQSLSPDGSLFYWNGLNEDGHPVPVGNYRIIASTRVGETPFEASAWVEVKD